MTELVEAIAARAADAARAWAALPPSERAEVLLAMADSVEAQRTALVAVAAEETGLTTARLEGELTRTVMQARLFADVVQVGAQFEARIDMRDVGHPPAGRPDLRRYLVPVGPVINFGASNFPFAFSVFGGDSVSALAAGCPVIVKIHSGHPRLGRLTAEAVQAPLTERGLAGGVFQVVTGQEAGRQLLTDARIRAATFTGSTAVGRMLADLAAARPAPIPFFGELGSVNPVFVLPGALEDDAAGLASGLAASVSGSAGQLCTKPGFVFMPRGADWEGILRTAFEGKDPHRLLTPSISTAYMEGVRRALSSAGVEVVVRGIETFEDELVWATPTVLRVGIEDLRRAPELADETFGPFTVVVEYELLDEALTTATAMFPGNLTASVHAAVGDDPAAVTAVLTWAAEHAGRVIWGGWPTGVAVTAAQQHGGPWPATTNDSSTSVGTAAIDRFLRPVAFQDVPERFLPPALQDANPWGVPQSFG